MASLRQLPAQRRSIALLLGFALVVKLLVPTGWMPAFAGHRMTLAMCGGYGPVSPTMAKAKKGAADQMHGGHSEHREHDKSGADQPCGFAALSFALAGPAAPALASLPVIHDSIPLVVPAVGVGRGLAAPPPPATGPPIIA